MKIHVQAGSAHHRRGRVRLAPVRSAFVAGSVLLLALGTQAWADGTASVRNGSRGSTAQATTSGPMAAGSAAGTHDGSVTGPRGSTLSHQSGGSSGDGVHSSSSTTLDSVNGVSGSSTTTTGDAGYTHSDSMSGPHGNSADHSGSAGNGSAARSADVQTQRYSRSVDGSAARGQGMDRSVESTGPRGTSRDSQTTVNRDTGADTSVTVTRPDGSTKTYGNGGGDHK